MDLDHAQKPRSYLVAYLLTEFGLIDLMHHFRKRLHFRHLKTWTHIHQGTLLKERCDYILGTDIHLLYIVGIRDMRKYSSYHFALQARLLQRPSH